MRRRPWSPRWTKGKTREGSRKKKKRSVSGLWGNWALTHLPLSAIPLKCSSHPHPHPHPLNTSASWDHRLWGTPAWAELCKTQSLCFVICKTGITLQSSESFARILQNAWNTPGVVPPRSEAWCCLRTLSGSPCATLTGYAHPEGRSTGFFTVMTLALLYHLTAQSFSGWSALAILQFGP